MPRLLFISFLLSTISTCLAQTEGESTYTVVGTAVDATLPEDSVRLILRFTDEKDEIVRAKIGLEMLGDTLCLVPDSLGGCNVLLPYYNGETRLHFLSKLGYDLVIDSIGFGRQTETLMTVQFVTKPVQLKGLFYDLGKPVIYLYPTLPTAVDVRIGFDGDLGFTYPDYGSGWSVMAQPNGDIRHGNRLYKYLFWEGQKQLSEALVNFDEGFCVRTDSLVPFFENTLRMAGLTESEAQDFITFWVPKMRMNELNLVHFLFTEEYSELATLHVNPQPDNLIRVFVLWKGVDSESERAIRPQVFPAFKRDGFTVVEWGGSELREELD